MHADDSGLEGVHIGQAILDCDEGGGKASILGSIREESSGKSVIFQDYFNEILLIDWF